MDTAKTEGVILPLRNLKKEIELLATIQNGDFASRAAVMLFNLGKVAEAFGINLENISTKQVIKN